MTIRSPLSIAMTKIRRALIPTQKEVEMKAYCMKCRDSREIKDPEQITMKNGTPATQGKCPTCGTKVFRIGKARPA